YYATPGPMTELGPHAGLVVDLPADAVCLSEIVRGLLVHNSVPALSAIALPPERFEDMKRTGAVPVLDGILDLDANSLETKRPVERCMVGFCYHFALLHCAFLRAKHVPCRTRCGFASYFRTGRWIDHWVVEYWDGEHWRVHDTQLGRDALSAEAFQDGPAAWGRCRVGAGDPSHYGNEVFWGWDELRGSLVNDIGALNKVEVGGWKWCDLIAVDPIDQPHTEVDQRLDSYAALASTRTSLSNLRDAFEKDDAVQPPPGVTND
ncbi:MAG TPA: transglutaminase domain-containing protein, partial [Acidimicrobiales bacterium]|nr:transglutaminase domain-containing protein [Acidimicrobiales bacterium]